MIIPQRPEMTPTKLSSMPSFRICPWDLLPEPLSGATVALPRGVGWKRVCWTIVLLLANVTFCKAVAEITDPAFWVDVVADEVV